MRSVRVFLALTVFTLVVSGALFAATRRVSESVWPMTFNGHNGCTVTSINQEKHYWLTAAHCVDASGDDEPTVRAIMGEPIEPVAVDYKVDVAVVQTARASAPALKLATTAPQLEDPIRMVGYPFGFPFQVTVTGAVAALDAPLANEDGSVTRFMLVNMTGAPGNSGSAILNTAGEVVSVLQIGWGRSFSPMMGGVPFSELSAYRRYFEH